MRTPSSQTCRLDLAPPLADRFILGFPIDYGPVLLLMPFRFHLAVDTLPSGVLQSGGSRSVLAISSFRLRARLDVFIPSTLSGQRGYEPRFWIWRPSFERQRDFNPPEQCAAQRTCPYGRPHDKMRAAGLEISGLGEMLAAKIPQYATTLRKSCGAGANPAGSEP